MQTNSIGTDRTAKWLRRTAWLILIIVAIADVTVTFGSSLGIHSSWF